MTTQPADEDILIQAARAERGQHRSGKSMVSMLAVAVTFGVLGCLLIFAPRLLSAILPGPLRLILGLSFFVSVPGFVALAIAGFFLLASLASSPLASWGSKVPGDCPSCGQPQLRSDMVPSQGTANAGEAPRGVVTLCETPGCDYAAARVTRPSR